MVHGFRSPGIPPPSDAADRRCRVHGRRIDVRGYGGSDKPPPFAELPDGEDLADSWPDRALSADKRAILIGHDWGAPSVWNTALIHPEKVRGVRGFRCLTWHASAAVNGIHRRAVHQRDASSIRLFPERGLAERRPRRTCADFLRSSIRDPGEARMGRGPLDKPVDAKLLDRLPDPSRFRHG